MKSVRAMCASTALSSLTSSSLRPTTRRVSPGSDGVEYVRPFRGQIRYRSSKRAPGTPETGRKPIVCRSDYDDRNDDQHLPPSVMATVSLGQLVSNPAGALRFNKLQHKSVLLAPMLEDQPGAVVLRIAQDVRGSLKHEAGAFDLIHLVGFVDAM